MIQSPTWATFFEFSALCQLASLRVVTSQIVIMTKPWTFYMVATKNSPARCEIDTDFIPTVLDSLLLVEFRKTIGISITNLFLRQTVILVSYPQKNLCQLWDFGRFSLILQRKILDFKSCPKCWQAIHNHSNVFLRRSSAFGKRDNKYTGSVPFKTAPLKNVFFAISDFFWKKKSQKCSVFHQFFFNI